MSLSLLSTSFMWNISKLFWGSSWICVYSPRATPLVNKSHIPSWPQNDQYVSWEISIVPSIWKSVDISPIPKEIPLTGEGDLRPISLTSCISKVLEEFVVEWILEDIGGKIDLKQFGCVWGSCYLLFARYICSIPGCLAWTLKVTLCELFYWTLLITKLIDLGSVGPWFRGYAIFSLAENWTCYIRGVGFRMGNRERLRLSKN